MEVLPTPQNAKEADCSVLADFFYFNLCFGMKIFVTSLKTGTEFGKPDLPLRWHSETPTQSNYI